MKKLFFLLLLAGATVTFSCNPKSNTADKKTHNNEDVTNNDDEEDVETKATGELCDCVNNTLEGMSSKARKILIKAGNSDDPAGTLKEEVQNIDDQEQKQKIANEFQQFENDTQLQKCSDKIKKKYDINDDDKKVQKKIMRAAKENDDCELTYALMKIGLQQQPAGNNNNQ